MKNSSYIATNNISVLSQSEVWTHPRGKSFIKLQEIKDENRWSLRIGGMRSGKIKFILGVTYFFLLIYSSTQLFL